MSNFRAIATVTATLALEIVQPAAQAAVNGARVSTTRPDSSQTAAQVNLYLYQVTPNAAWRNSDLPDRDSRGQLVQRPRVALDLHYLFTFYGKENELEPQLLLSNVALAMHTHSTLTRDLLQQVIIDAANNNPANYRFLAESNLADDVELVKFTPLPLSLEELTKLWSVFFQEKHALSIAYLATVVLIEGEATPRAPLPVREREFFVRPFRHPAIERVQSQTGPREPIVATSTLIIEGTQLRSEVTQLRIGGSDLMNLPSEKVTDTKIEFSLASLTPAGILRAGVQPLQIVQPQMLGRPRVEHTGVESNVMPVVIRPALSNLALKTPLAIALTVNPTVGQSQRVVLLLNRTTGSEGTSFAFTLNPRSIDQNSLEIPIDGVQAGEYWVRLQIDGAESVLAFTQDANGNPIADGPKILIRPTIAQIVLIDHPPDPKHLEIKVDVVVGQLQMVTVTLTPVGGGAPVQLIAPPRSADTHTVNVPIGDTPAGTYDAWIAIDGVTNSVATRVTIP